MAKTVGDYPIPFDKDGNQLHYPGYGSIDWRPNTEFVGVLKYEGFSRGRSAAYFNFRTADGKSVTVFLKEMDEMMPHMNGGKVVGVFKFVKRGENYGCTLIRPA